MHFRQQGFSLLAGIILSFMMLTPANGQFAQQGSKLIPTDHTAHGYSVSLSADGNRAIVGGPSDNLPNTSRGAARVFTRANGIWSQEEKLFDAAAGWAMQDYAVSLSGDRNTAIVGGYFAPLNFARPDLSTKDG